jgi:hypothetical protein
LVIFSSETASVVDSTFAAGDVVALRATRGCFCGGCGALAWIGTGSVTVGAAGTPSSTGLSQNETTEGDTLAMRESSGFDTDVVMSAATLATGATDVEDESSIAVAVG